MKHLESQVCTEEEQVKQDEKRRANREAAKRCRQRKQKKTEQLESQVKELQETLLEVNTNWQEAESKVDAYKCELKKLRTIIKLHMNEGCRSGVFDPQNIEKMECWQLKKPGKETISSATKPGNKIRYSESTNSS